MDLVDSMLLRIRKPPDDVVIRRLGWRVAARYFAWRNHLPLAEVIAALARRTGLPGDSPLPRTARAIGPALLRWGGHPYHSIVHHAEVATSAMLMAALAPAPVSPHGLGLLLCAALAHDLDFEPAHAATGRFAAERRSAEALDAIAAAAGVGDADRLALRLLILATEPLARGGLRALLRAGEPHPDADLRPLAARPELRDLAALISDADMLPSSGLNEPWQARQQDRLGREWGRTVTLKDQSFFFQAILGPDYLSPGGQMFLPNMQRIRAAALAAL